MTGSKTMAIFAALWVALSHPQLAYADAIDDLEPGHWYRAPNTQLQGVDPCPARPCSYSGSLGVYGVMAAWSGAALDTTRSRLLVWGGGHGDYFGNEVYAFDVGTLSWSRLTDPSLDVGGDEASGLNPDGTPRSRHSRNTLAYSPEIDSFIAFGAPGTNPSACCGDNMVHVLNLAGTPTWDRLADIPTSGAHRGVLSYDAVAGVIWHMTSGDGRLGKFDPQANTWTHAGFASEPLSNSATSAIDPQRRTMLVIGSGGEGQAFVWDLDEPQDDPYDLTTDSTFNATNAYGLANRIAPGLDFDSVRDRYVLWDGGATVYLIHPETWAVEQVDPAPSNTVIPTSPPNAGTFGRFRYIASRNVFIAVNSTDEDVYFYRLTANGPPDTVAPMAPSDLEAE